MDASSVCVTMLTDNAETELSHMLRSLLCLGKRTVRCASARHITSLGLDFFYATLADGSSPPSSSPVKAARPQSGPKTQDRYLAHGPLRPLQSAPAIGKPASEVVAC